MAINLHAVALSKKYINETSESLGAIKGAPCTIKETKKTSTGTSITFQWEGTDGALQNTTIELLNGNDGTSITNIIVDNNNLYFTLSDGQNINAGKINTLQGEKGKDGVYPKTIYITPENKLIVTLSDGETIDAGTITFQGKISYSDILDSPTIPVSISQLTNDSDFINNTVDNLLNYYSKAETYSKKEVSDLLGNLNRLTTAIVNELPTSDISTTTIYLTLAGDSSYEQHMYISGRWADLGSTKLDLTNYVTKTDLNTALSGKADLQHSHEGLHSHNNKAALDSITNEKIEKWNQNFGGDYNDLTNKPSIPKVTNDLTDELKSAYDEAVTKSHTHINKSVIDKISENSSGEMLFNGNKIQAGTDITVSETLNNAILQKDDGIWVEDKTAELNSVKDTFNRIAAKKFSNCLMEYCLRSKDSTLDQEKVSIVENDNILKYITNIHGNMENTVDNYIKLKKGKTYMLRASIFPTKTLSYHIVDKDGNTYGARGYNTPSNANLPYCDSHATCVIEAKDDMYLTLIVKNVSSGTILYSSTSWFSVEEIGSKVEIDPLEYANENDGIEDTPVGHILAHMGTTAPKHYLICDGAIYNILDYPHLAEHFRKDFGAVNYFGGDGLNTFAVPDMRNEFIRGYHGNSTELLSGEIGIHQDATSSPLIQLWSDSGGSISYAGDIPGTHVYPSNMDTESTKLTKNRYASTVSGKENLLNGVGAGASYTSRPTNVAVLYCIKYEPTYFANFTSYGYDADVLFEGSAAGNLKDWKLNYSLDDYDFVQLWSRNIDNSYTNIIINKDIYYLSRPGGVVPQYENNLFTVNLDGTGQISDKRIFFRFKDNMTLSTGQSAKDCDIFKIYGYKKKLSAEKSYNKELQSVIVEGAISSSQITKIPLPFGYTSNNCIIRSFNIHGTTDSWYFPFNNNNIYVQILDGNIIHVVNNAGAVFNGRKFRIEFAKVSSVVEQSKYSTDETPIGTWIDGKTIYRKVAKYDSVVPSQTTKLVIGNVGANIDSLIKVNGVCVSVNTGNFITLPLINDNANSVLYITLLVNANGDVLITNKLTTGIDKLTYSVEYTKNE